MINIPVSIGELVDKVSILNIKLQKISNPDKLLLVSQELNLLLDIMYQQGIHQNDTQYIQLLDINTQLWDIEDQIRILEKNKQFDQLFINLTRKVYLTNDQRASIKKKINLRFNSEIQEVKEYIQY